MAFHERNIIPTEVGRDLKPRDLEKIYRDEMLRQTWRQHVIDFSQLHNTEISKEVKREYASVEKGNRAMVGKKLSSQVFDPIGREAVETFRNKSLVATYVLLSRLRMHNVQSRFFEEMLEQYQSGQLSVAVVDDAMGMDIVYFDEDELVLSQTQISKVKRGLLQQDGFQGQMYLDHTAMGSVVYFDAEFASNLVCGLVDVVCLNRALEVLCPGNVVPAKQKTPIVFANNP